MCRFLARVNRENTHPISEDQKGKFNWPSWVWTSMSSPVVGVAIVCFTFLKAVCVFWDNHRHFEVIVMLYFNSQCRARLPQL